MEHIKCILFDTDGVVIDSPTELFSVKLARENNIPDEDILPFFKNIFVPLCMTGKADLKEELTPILSKWHWSNSVDDLLRKWFESERDVNQGVISFIQSAHEKNIICALATNQEKYRTEYLRNELGFGETFDRIYSSCELGYKKPSIDFYSTVYDHLYRDFGFEKREILYIDDDDRNIASGKEFGFRTLLFKNISSIRDLTIF